jgi:hypothetical protein
MTDRLARHLLSINRLFTERFFPIAKWGRLRRERCCAVPSKSLKKIDVNELCRHAGWFCDMH